MRALRATTRKTLRDLTRQRAQVAAVAVTVMLGIALYAASAGAFRNLSSSYAYTYDRLHFADLVADGGSPEAVAAAAREAGAAAATVRTQIDPPMLIDGTKLVGRAVGMPTRTRPAVDDVDLSSGAYLSPEATDGVLVERHAAETFGLSTGDTLQVFADARWHTVTVRGVVRSPEYLWPARSRQEVLSDPHTFAVLFAPERTVRQWAATGPNQTLVTLPTATPPAQAAKVRQAMRDAGAVDVADRADQPSDATLREDLAGFDELSVAFPLLFLSAAAVASYVLLARRVLAERALIGTLMAAGARRGRVVRHYLGQGLVVGLLGAAGGLVLGALATGAVTRAYTTQLGIPDTVVTWHPVLALNGALFGVFVGLTGAAAPALAAARTAPAEAMRNQSEARPHGAWSRFVARLHKLPITVRMALHDVARSRRRTSATMLGTVLAMSLVLASIGMLTSFSQALAVQFTQIQRQDATVSVTSGSPGTETRLQALPGVATVEQSRTAAVTATYGSRSYTTVLNGFAPHTAMHRFRSVSGTWTTMPTDGVLAGTGLVDRLHVAVGDTLTLTTADRTLQVRLAGLLDEPLGTVLYAPDQTLTPLLPYTGTDTYLIRFTPGADHDAMRRQITQLPFVVAYADTHAVTHSVDQYLGLLWVFIGSMVVLGALLAFAVIYVTMAVNVVERTNELAALRVAGVPLRRVAGTLATENLLATTLGLPIGLLLGVFAAQGFLASFSSDLFHLELHLAWWTLPAAGLGVLAAAALSQWPAARAVRRLDLARVVRERAG